ncbi:MAG: SpoIID/LytB domain-containing protein [Thermoanaerobacterales bacterium]|nr:SpoIID/LytB domain-containing protein [Bacillota bacterium]MDI6906810.1 SpoIID/LytB domain-containing protein [Thermoanaerobacterales bacterium]
MAKRVKHSGRKGTFLILACLLVLLLATGTAAGVRGEEPLVRVALLQGVSDVSFRAGEGYTLVNTASGALIADCAAGETWQVRPRGDRLQVLRGGETLGTFSGPVVLRGAKGKPVTVAGAGGRDGEVSLDSGKTAVTGEGRLASLPPAGSYTVRSAAGMTTLEGGSAVQATFALQVEGSYRRYRGDLVIKNTGGDTILAVNELPVEQYLYSVVPSEMPYGWPAEALKAQAVAARTYALERVKARNRDYDVVPNTGSQVYHGAEWERPETTAAVEATRGVVLVHRGELIAAFFHSSSGGCTEDAEDVWTARLPYIRAQDDPYDRNPAHYGWQVSYSADQLAAQMAAKGFIFGEPLPPEPSRGRIAQTVLDIEELERTSTGRRVEKVRVTGLDPYGRPAQLEIYNADRVRIAFGLKSSYFTMMKKTDRSGRLLSITFTGNGWGHGLGMSQWGARGMAEAGFSYGDILRHYYADTEIVTNYAY